ncbi:uncharacterized protein CANTADRAFT_55552 [Suhomyces tanzawaensis NRRL Y-17324]|uniref:Uncharacterized protein n=1 Tax=Suhomyces tanzawaensis NRRL Y-17324 TaxID=984487 RepID=A0A1E4SCG0_9ASCO|nr:uncharacterized protein CANTADRAFT_55552 [Suhomyces tanzawaensis NRRL Y-17324]ODV77189.1 hypothetical protein CANTADRAFT_55552 [Suhomyces tanzawaensis NRRL Y-17324]
MATINPPGDHHHHLAQTPAPTGISASALTDDKHQISFQYANECDLEIHCSPFGLSGLYIKVTGTNLMGIGLAMGLITGSTKGLIHYNDLNDLIDQKYKLYVIVDDEGMLRIDFTKIFTLHKDKPEDKDAKDEEEVPTLIFRGKCPEGRPDNIEPFIGIFSFERED